MIITGWNSAAKVTLKPILKSQIFEEIPQLQSSRRFDWWNFHFGLAVKVTVTISELIACFEKIRRFQIHLVGEGPFTNKV